MFTRPVPTTVRLTGFGAAALQIGPITGTVIASVIDVSLLCSWQLEPQVMVQFRLDVDLFFVEYNQVWNLFSMPLGFDTPPNFICNNI
jgi:hypothetical protein